MSPQSQKDAGGTGNLSSNLQKQRRDSGNFGLTSGSGSKGEIVSQSMQLAQMRAELNQGSAAARKGNS